MILNDYTIHFVRSTFKTAERDSKRLGLGLDETTITFATNNSDEVLIWFRRDKTTRQIHGIQPFILEADLIRLKKAIQILNDPEPKDDLDIRPSWKFPAGETESEKTDRFIKEALSIVPETALQ